MLTQVLHACPDWPLVRGEITNRLGEQALSTVPGIRASFHPYWCVPVASGSQNSSELCARRLASTLVLVRFEGKCPDQG